MHTHTHIHTQTHTHTHTHTHTIGNTNSHTHTQTHTRTQLEQAVPKDADVVVVGAGVAGLACCMHLTKAGIKPVLLEASDGVGGRVRTDEVLPHNVYMSSVSYARHNYMRGHVTSISLHQ